MRFNSLAFRLFATSAIWTLLVLPLAGYLIYSLYRDDVQLSFDAQLKKLLTAVTVDSMNTTGDEPVVPPPTTMLGALYRYMREADPRHFQPMNANFGLVPELGTRVKDKRIKKEKLAERALADMARWRDESLVASAVRA